MLFALIFNHDPQPFGYCHLPAIRLQPVFMMQNIQMSKRGAFLIFLVIMVVLLAPRVAHLSGPIDEPHSWRQCDTAQYARAFYEDGIDLLYPSVCWLGAHKTIIFEFPFPEACMAIFYHVFSPDLLYARIVALLFFCGSALYLYLILRFLLNRKTAFMAVLIYCILPLSLFYSRAMHIDFSAVCFAHAMFYYFLVGYSRGSFIYLLCGAITGVMAFMIKVPYAFYFALPLGIYVLCHFNIKKVLMLGLTAMIPVLAFVAWQCWVFQINDAAPEWWHIPGYNKLTSMGSWYFGDVTMRLKPDVWKTIGDRIIHDVTGMIGLCCFVVGLVISLMRRKVYGRSHIAVLWAWLFGVMIYWQIFIRLNHIHNYYQIPFLAIGAAVIAICLDSIYEVCEQKRKMLGVLITLVLFVSLAAENIRYAETHYYDVNPFWSAAGTAIRERTEKDDLVIVSFVGSRGNPQVLYHADRYGFPIDVRVLNQDVLQDLSEIGATHLAVFDQIGEPDYYSHLFKYNEPLVEPLADTGWFMFFSPLPAPQTKTSQPQK